ncbi:MAG: type II toxin-antitoxin system PemK/MazF family toxin [Patescibacteria group bacterium]
MGIFTVGDVVLINFPYADFTKFKRRPSLVVGQAEFNNLILCQITSKAEISRQAIHLSSDDFSDGRLKVDSFIRPDKIFTVEPLIVITKIGHLKSRKIEKVKGALRKLFV